ncbi:zinc ribbon domain-containing protein [Ruminococcus gauvreauii]|uniref:Zinc ribbon domain-containing protein n=1 Tax=Ruminococcus gauvreauii TaxID=438033 RepID=A0ABY5VFY7_9FIRM|nr:zinc ribbon domain-containing protein [Ruminococcus gauvreauii]UWP59415.1 zinc ribbon domain-containing protein [Ruminococcus gauvreauii]
MGTFNSTKFIPTALTDYEAVITRAEEYFQSIGYSFSRGECAMGNYFSLSKGGVFKAVLGMKTALNVELTPMTGGVSVAAKVGIFGQQLIPSVISAFFLWPVLLTQITGMVQQSQLDEQVIQFVEQTIRQIEYTAPQANSAPTQASGSFCTNCGASIPEGARFCCGCGAKTEV